MPVPTALALEDVTVAVGARTLLAGVTAGVAERARIGVVGRNGSGKSTLLRVLAGELPVDGGRVVRASGLTVARLPQEDVLDPSATLADVVVDSRPEHAWAADPRIRTVFGSLLGGVSAADYPRGLATPVGTMSGGERRRAALARLLVADPDVLLLDEPTNHLDLEGVAALARAVADARAALVVVTHDRWFLDAVCTQTWEVAGGRVHRQDGGYAAYVLASAERARALDAAQARRRNLLRTELAWLRRGPPARTSKPRFRIEAANALIADVPPPRDRLQLQQAVTARLGRQVLDLEDVTLRPAGGGPVVLDRVTWRLGPGDRVGLLGPNGAGKTTLLRLLDDEPVAVQGRVRRGRTVRAARLSQDLAEMDPIDRVLPALERVRAEVEVGRGRTQTARQLLEGFGFTGERLVTRIGELSGGERRRLQLLRLLVAGPNLLLLDEPTNDLDVETLTVLEDLLDGWPGTLVVVSHDRYFLERVCDDLVALPGDGTLRHLPTGVDGYLALRQAVPAPGGRDRSPAGQPAPTESRADTDRTGPLTGGAAYEARKELARLDRRLARLAAEEHRLHAALEAAATDHVAVLRLDSDLRRLHAERAEVEDAWLALAERLDG